MGFRDIIRVKKASKGDNDEIQRLIAYCNNTMKHLSYTKLDVENIKSTMDLETREGKEMQYKKVAPELNSKINLFNQNLRGIKLTLMRLVSKENDKELVDTYNLILKHFDNFFKGKTMIPTYNPNLDKRVNMNTLNQIEQKLDAFIELLKEILNSLNKL